MMPELVALGTVLGMAVVTYATRAGGARLVSIVPLTRRLQVFLRHLASSVMVAIVVGGVARGDVASALAILASVGVMLTTKSAIGAMAAGVAVAATWRALAPL